MEDDLERRSLIQRIWQHVADSKKGRLAFIVVGIALIAAVTFAAFNGINPVPAGMFVKPDLGTYYNGDTFTVSVYADLQSDYINSVGIYLKYDGTVILPDGLQNIKPGSAWGPNVFMNAPKILPSSLCGTNCTLEVIIGQPSPGIISYAGAMEIARIPFRVLDVTTAGTTELTFDETRSALVKDDASGTNILSWTAPASYDIFPALEDRRCLIAHPDARECSGTNYCPGAKYPDPPGGWIGSVECCQVDCIERGTGLTIDSNSISVEVIVDPTDPMKAIANFTWRTNMLSNEDWVIFAPVGNPLVDSQPASHVTNDPDLNHLVSLTGLPLDTLFTARVVSSRLVNGQLQATESIDIPFGTTLQNLQRKLTINNVFARGTSNTTGIVGWTTPFLLSTGQVDCVQTSPGGRPCFASLGNTAAVTVHTFRIQNLQPGTTYSFEVVSELLTNTYQDISGLDREARATGSFTTRSDAIESDSNVILRVNRDRQCANWLTCESSLRVKNRTGKTEDMCFALNECDTIDSVTGACARVSSGHNSNEFLIKWDDPDRSTVDLARNLSGNSTAGLDVAGFTTGTATSSVKLTDLRISGIDPYATLKERGSTVTIPNASFEDASAFPWEGYPKVDSEISTNEVDLDTGGFIMSVRPSTANVGGTATWGTGVPLRIDPFSSDQTYFLTFQVKGAFPVDTAPLRVQKLGLLNVDLYVEGFGKPVQHQSTITAGWQQIIVAFSIPDTAPRDKTYYLRFSASPDEDPNDKYRPMSSFQLDNIFIQPVLETGENRIARECRAYPSSSAPSCNFIDVRLGKQFKGWKGYCLVRDPQDDRECLQWWPLDVVGSSVFGADQANFEFGSGGLRYPLYYCLEAEGNAPYVRSIQIHSVNNGNLSCPRNSDTKMEPYAPGGNCSSVYTFVGGKYNASDIAAIKISWYFARDDNNCTLKNNENVIWLTAANKFTATGNITHDVGGQDVTSFEITYDKGSFLAKACSSRGGAAGTVWKIQATYHLREACYVMAQVVSPNGEHRAHFGNLLSEQYAIPRIGYMVGFDAIPFGASVHPDPDNNPAAWVSRLFIEPAFDALGDGLGQARAGQPYGVRTPGVYCRNNPSDIDCKLAQNDPVSGGDNPTCEPVSDLCVYDPFDEFGGYRCQASGLPCNNANGDADCNLSSNQVCELQYGVNIGPSVCISGSELGKGCRTHDECGEDEGGNPGVCTGPQKPEQISWDEYARQLSASYSVQPPLLSNLFGKTYGTWQFVPNRGYVQICAEDGQSMCSGGQKQGTPCSMDSECGGFDPVTQTNPTCGYMNGSSYDVGSGACARSASDGKRFGWNISQLPISAKPPRIESLKVNDMPAHVKDCTAGKNSCFFEELSLSPDQEKLLQGVESLPVTFSFTAHVDASHLPLKRYTVDWGDGDVSGEDDLSVKPREDWRNPYMLGHVYKYHDPAESFPEGCVGGECRGTFGSRPSCVANRNLCDGVSCVYCVRVQVEDNWEWCNENSTNTTTATPMCGLNAPDGVNGGWTYFTGKPGGSPNQGDAVVITVTK